jgi:class 3 adenylate cyclase
MAKYARDCLLTVQQLLPALAEDLGPDTLTLGLRIGLHSGPVTAGVLRGDKARFELFGDTVNTTSRMESTGEKDRIHLSEQTAALLSAQGRGHWLIARDEVVAAKGKGELKTFWLDTARAYDGESYGRPTLPPDEGSEARI